MSEQKPYIIKCGGKKLTVSKNLYLYYYRSERRFRYYEHDIKIETEIRDKNRKIARYTPSKETSFDQITEGGVEFADDGKRVEDAVACKLMLDKLGRCLSDLAEDERWLIGELFFNKKSEHRLATESGIPRMTLCNRKYAVLRKLKKMMESKK